MDPRPEQPLALPRAEDLGRVPYREAYGRQCSAVEAVLAARESGAPGAGTILFLEHDPVVTVSRREGALRNLVASREQLARAGVALEEKDRGGDITYHGPGQLVVYPILDLNALNLGLHAYMRLLESAVINACADFGVAADREPGATGVWVTHNGIRAKLCAMGVRVRKWVSMHGLALNVSTDLSHFGLIVPCGLAGRPVTSLAQLLGTACPPMEDVKQMLLASLRREIGAAAGSAARERSGHLTGS